MEIRDLLTKHRQEKLLRHYDALPDGAKARLAAQLEKVDWSLLSLIGGENHTNLRGELAPLGATELAEIETQRVRYTEAGLAAIRAGKVAAVLLAGGQGTRLGWDKPKGTYNIGITRPLYIFECLIRNLQEVTEAAGCPIPLYIMTSDKNNADTVAFFEEHDYFGYGSENVRFFVQEMAPAVSYEGDLYLEAPDRLALSPNGNGGWFSSLEKSGCLAEMRTKGVEWLNAFAVDNVCQRICSPDFVGATILSGSDCGAKVVSKAFPTEKLGVLCLEDGKPSIVEYYEMTEDMVTLRDDCGELLYRFGVILNYLFKIESLTDIANRRLPVHMAEKKIPHIDGDGNFVKPTEPNGYKFESLILDMIHMMDSCLAYEVVREKEFAPVKNATGVDSVESARALLERNGVTL
ncbi:MAG: UDPGP type 1 family protein [Clostridia bacterium]|nr:UDPGP type 1 family protein [Clostridia bacterium]